MERKLLLSYLAAQRTLYSNESCSRRGRYSLRTFVVVGYRKDDGFLVADVAGSELRIVGTVQYGFSQSAHKELLGKLRPAVDREITKRKRDDGLIWFEPSVLIEVEFMQWTQKGLLRFPVFKDFSDAKALAYSTT